ncbi:MAG: cupin domain-containing protein [Pseudomonadota bacterium]
MLNMDFEKSIVITPDQQEWEASPMAGVWRKRFAFEEKERGHATSVVRFDPGSRFSRHEHPLGEEIFVLSGVFSDESGDFPAGTYFRNPEGFAHAPHSDEGCELFVKLHQFKPEDSLRVCIDTHSADWSPGHGNSQVLPLHSFQGEQTALVKWPAGEKFIPHQHWSGEEIFVICGEFIDEHGRYPAGSWLRSPRPSSNHPLAEKDTIILVKTGHLA